MKKIKVKDVDVLYSREYREKGGCLLLSDYDSQLFNVNKTFFDEQLSKNNGLVTQVNNGLYVNSNVFTIERAYESLFAYDDSYSKDSFVYKYSVLFKNDRYLNQVLHTSDVLEELMNLVSRRIDKVKNFELRENGLSITFVSNLNEKDDSIENLSNIVEFFSKVSYKSLLMKQDKNNNKEFFYSGFFNPKGIMSTICSKNELNELTCYLENSNSKYDFEYIKAESIEEIISLYENKVAYPKKRTFVSIELSESNEAEILRLVKVCRVKDITLLIVNKDKLVLHNDLKANTYSFELARNEF